MRGATCVVLRGCSGPKCPSYIFYAQKREGVRGTLLPRGPLLHRAASTRCTLPSVPPLGPASGRRRPAMPSQRNCRESAEVPFFSSDNVWQAVVDDVIKSADVDPTDMKLRMQPEAPPRYELKDCAHDPRAGRDADRGTEHVELATSPVPARRMAGRRGPTCPPKGPPPARPNKLAHLTEAELCAYILCLTTEMRGLDDTIARLKRENTALNKVVEGLCSLRLERG